MIGVWAVTAIAAALAGGALYQKAGALRDRRRLPPPGSVVGGLHVQAAGAGKPTVVFEAGIAASSLSWSRVQPEVAEFARAISYDRAGLAWSGRCRGRLTLEDILDGLRTVIGRERPCVLVGHSFGALIVQIYAARNPDDIAGLILIDPPPLAEWADPTPARRQMLARGIALSRRGALLCRFGIVRGALVMLAGGARAIPKAINKASSGRGASLTQRLVGEVQKLPRELWPAVQSHWSRGECFQSMAEHLACLPEAAAAAAHVPSLGDVPLVVISGAHLTESERAGHAAISRRSERGKHLSAPAGAHWVHLDDPKFVVAAVRQVVDEVRRSRALSR
jgi:pimeloyl-ACP methyl ester carboxylesterase